jgi:predicted DNA repair protein MutK
MAGTSLLALIDDIASLLDDVGTLTKVATNKTAGVLGDDLALNAEQVSGVRPERELPVVWAVAKGSAVNKLILVPGALLMSAFIPWAITPLLLIGGAFLCFEGFEKIVHKLLHPTSEKEHKKKLEAVADDKVDLVALEKDKIKGAIRTDFILSAEIVVIALGSVQEAPLLVRALTIATVASLVTVGVYSLVAGIVKLDDAGVALCRTDAESPRALLKHKLGKALLWGAPRLLETLSVLGTVAMFLVGGGIIAHGLPFVGHFVHGAHHAALGLPSIGPYLGAVTPTLSTFVVGLAVGALLVGLLTALKKLRPERAAT